MMTGVRGGQPQAGLRPRFKWGPRLVVYPPGIIKIPRIGFPFQPTQTAENHWQRVFRQYLGGIGHNPWLRRRAARPVAQPAIRSPEPEVAVLVFDRQVNP